MIETIKTEEEKLDGFYFQLNSLSSQDQRSVMDQFHTEFESGSTSDKL